MNPAKRTRGIHFPRQFSLKALMAATGALAVGIALLAGAARNSIREGRLAARVEELGGSATTRFLPWQFGKYVTCIDLRRGMLYPEPDARKWFLLVSPAFYPEPVISDRDIEFIIGCGHLRELALCGADVSDTGIVKIGAHAELSRLDISGTRVTNRGLAAVSRLGNLVELDLSATSVTDEGIALLSGLRRLAFLKLNGCCLTNKSVTTISGLANLRKLQLVDSGIDSRGVAAIRRALPHVEVVGDRADLETSAGKF